MIQCFEIDSKGLHPVEWKSCLQSNSGRQFWIDIVRPDPLIISEIEERLQINILTPEEIAQSGPISRLYKENSALFMTMTAVAHSESEPTRTPVTFVMTNSYLITLRYEDLVAFKSFHTNCLSRTILPTTKEAVLISILEELIDRLSDLLEISSSHADDISRSSFEHQEKPEFDMAGIGRVGDLTSKIRDSLLSIRRLLLFLGDQGGQFLEPSLKTVGKNVTTLLDQSNFLFNHITFVLDATLGVINIEQNRTIKIFSVVAVIFLPPTLIASIYGMNFHFMPELDHPWGYPMALVTMLISAVVPFWIFKKMRWL